MANMDSSLQQSSMSELREIARLHYETASLEVKRRAVDFFSSMDADGDGEVDIGELWAFMSEHGHPAHFSDHRFFSLLDTDGSGGLSFDEVKTLFYVMASRRPFCFWCSHFIAGVFFSCSDCPFVLCPDCFRDAQARNHFHDGRPAHFLDTYAFLRTLLSPHQRPEEAANVLRPSTSMIDRQTTIVVHQRTSNTEVAYKALMMALAAAPLIPCAIL